MDNKKHIIDLESFKNILHICPRVHGQPFVEPPFEEEILAFIHFLRHSAAIRTLIDVNINKLYQPWRSFAASSFSLLSSPSSSVEFQESSSSDSSAGTSGTPGLEPVPSSAPEPLEAITLGLALALGGVIDVSELLLVLLTLALGLGVASPQITKLLRVLVSGYQLDRGEHKVIPDIVAVHLVSPRNRRIR
uniref:Uncharacterized protein n=1 Tax=Tanacetum cinerariifolium TaxID=118510 RepID=A0A699Q4S6_TANCI|nr:hypothetical protein [Tanacetum cinerariifolium]